MKTPTTLVILDGYGLAPATPDNAIHKASTPYLDSLFSRYPNTFLSASGLDVGLPEGQMGNSEVGHTNIGAGRVVMQDLPRLNHAIADGSFFQNDAFCSAIEQCKARGSTLHLLGLLSDGGVHSHLSHLFALLRMAKDEGVPQVYVHAFLDGRDVSPTSGLGYLQECEAYMAELGCGQIATVSGRYYAMDRDNRWNRTQRAYDALVCGKAAVHPDAAAAVSASYAAGVTDEFVEPFCCLPDYAMQQEDVAIYFNYRPDRARALTAALTEPDFVHLQRCAERHPKQFICLTQYDETFSHVTVAFAPEVISRPFGAYLSELGLRQLRIAETEKYAHVTFFFNGGEETPFEGEDRVLIPSPKVATYDLVPEMSAPEVARVAAERIRSGAQIVVEATTDCGGIALVTADHGNAEQMQDIDGGLFTAHTTNPVPFAIVGADVVLRPGRLADIAPTMLDLMGFEKPEEMDGLTLITN